MATEFISNSWLMPTNANAEANRVSNYSLDFDGSSQYIETSSIDVTGVKSFSFWLKRNSSTTNDGAVLTFVNSGKTDDYMAIGLFGGSAAGGALLNAVTDNAGSTVKTSSSAIASDVWYHFVVVKSATAITAMYINGVSETLAAGGFYYSTATAPQSYLGRADFSGSNFYAEINLAEVSIFDYSLSSSQINQLYGTGSAIGNPMAITNGRKPVAYYPLGNAAFNSEFLVPNGAEQDYVFSFDGSNKITGTGALISGNESRSFSLWYKTTSTAAQIPFSLGSPTDQTNGAQFAYCINRSSTTNAAIFGKNSAYDTSVFTVPNTSDGNWHHLLVTYDQSSLKVYIDGNLEATPALPSTSYITSAGFTIGGWTIVGNRLFNGEISNVSVFNTALPATGTESVESLYNYGTPPNIASYSGLQGWWELDASATFDGSNFSIPDASGNSNTGTSSGMTAASLTQSDLIINQSYDPFSLLFDGVDERISFTETDLGLNNSISIWFKRPSTGYNVLIGQGSAWYDYAVRIESNGSIKYADRYTSPTITFDNASTKSIINNVNTWINIVIVRTGSTANLYVNGVDYDGSKSWGSGNEEGTVFNRLATAGDGTSYAFNGQLSNFASWNTSLTSAQALEVYNEAKPSNLNTHSASSSLVSWYRLGAVNTFYNSTTTEFTVLDEVGTNNGTSVNMEQADLVSGVGATGSGTSSGMGSGENRKGSAPFSENNAVSYNLSVLAKSSSTPT